MTTSGATERYFNVQIHIYVVPDALSMNTKQLDENNAIKNKNAILININTLQSHTEAQ